MMKNIILSSVSIILLGLIGCRSISTVKLDYPSDYKEPGSIPMSDVKERKAYLIGYQVGWQWFANQHEIRILTNGVSFAGPLCYRNINLLPDSAQNSPFQDGWFAGQAKARKQFEDNSEKIWKCHIKSKTTDSSQNTNTHMIAFMNAPVFMVLNEYADLAKKPIHIECKLFNIINSKNIIINLSTEHNQSAQKCLTLIEKELEKHNLLITADSKTQLKLIMKP